MLFICPNKSCQIENHRLQNILKLIATRKNEIREQGVLNLKHLALQIGRDFGNHNDRS